MAEEKYKLGLTRCRLFEFENCVSFVGDTGEKLDSEKLNTALSHLAMREPLITCTAVLEENGEAFLQPGQKKPSFTAVTGEAQDIVSAERRKGFDFLKELFRFLRIGESSIGIFAHTAAADEKTLFVLAGELLGFYYRTLVSVEPSKIQLFSEKKDLPAQVVSPITDKITDSLNDSWENKKVRFSAADYHDAREKYGSGRKEQYFYSVCLNEAETNTLSEYCHALHADVTSLFCFAFAHEAHRKLSGKKGYEKVLVEADERLYLEKPTSFAVGPFDGTFSLPVPSLKRPLKEGALKFHKAYYDKYTNPFYAFYDGAFFLSCDPSLCDASYLTSVGIFKNKTAQKTAKFYGCSAKRMLAFSAYNLDQQRWKALSGFCEIAAFPPYLDRADLSAVLLRQKSRLKLTICYRPETVCYEDVQGIAENAIKLLKSLEQN